MSIERKANTVLEQAKKLAHRAQSWADFSNVLFDQSSGIIAKTFPTPIERQAFFDTEQYKRILDLQTNLMRKFGVANGATPKEKSGKFIVRLAKTMHQKLEIEAKSEGVSLNQLAVTKLSLPLSHAIGLNKDAIIEAFNSVHEGHSQDWVIIDPKLNPLFLKRCRALGLRKNSDFELNHKLLNIRKSGRGLLNPTTQKSGFSSYDEFAFAAEIAVRILQRTEGVSLDRIVCDPILRECFDSYAMKLVNRPAIQLRAAALYLRKSRRLRPMALASDEYTLESAGPVKTVSLSAIASAPGTYVFYDRSRPLFAGETENLKRRIATHLQGGLPDWLETISNEEIILKYSIWKNTNREARVIWLDAFINKEHPLLNYQSSI